MLEPFYKNKFKQDVARMKKRGKQLKKLQEVISMLIEQQERTLIFLFKIFINSILFATLRISIISKVGRDFG